MFSTPQPKTVTVQRSGVEGKLAMPAKPSDFDTTYGREAVRLQDETGVFVAQVFKCVLGEDLQGGVMAALGDIDTRLPPSVSRRAAAGTLDVAAFGRSDIAGFSPEGGTSGHLVLNDGRTLKAVTSNPVKSYLAGWGWNRFKSEPMRHRATDIALESRDVGEVIDVMDKCIYQASRAAWSVMRKAMVRHGFGITDACTTLTINKNYESRYHYDSGDHPEGLAALAAFGRFRGGLLVLPDYRVAIDAEPGDVVVKRSKYDLHGNTAVYGDRVSLVLYNKAALSRAGDKEKRC